ncbi:MAG: hypothetical protein EOO05_00295 [Chitinophagaceae bacterium]|nr:MAG: hypothetical protein EOO05_00295 [Chitinophagaceae bacterium]
MPRNPAKFLYRFTRSLPVIAMAILPFTGRSQLLDSLNVSVGTVVTGASKGYQPFWNSAKRWGTISESKFDASTFVMLSNSNTLARLKGYDTTETGRRRALTLKYGAALYNNNHFEDMLLEQAYAKLSLGAFQVAIGRYEDPTGDMDHQLSMGSFGVSGNALPVPKLSISIPVYTPIHLLNDYVSVKGTLAHGWFGNNRFMQDAFYHEKTFYLKFGKKRFKYYGGLQHFGEWGGHRKNFILDRSFQGFLDVLLVKEANDGSVPNNIAPSRAGDQRGLLEAGIDYEGDKILWHGYAQMPFESGEEVDIRNRSFQAGVHLQFVEPKTTGISKLLVEFIFTKDMNDFVIDRQRQSYYNNGAYRTGWEYEDRVVGTPVFINRIRTSKYFPSVIPFEWQKLDSSFPGNKNILNNRVVGGNLGLFLNIVKGVTMRSIWTITKNYGDLDPASLYKPNKFQAYTLNEFYFAPTASKFDFMFGIAYDFGDLTKNVGAIAGCRYSLRK